jgi:hypothetical protein
LGINGGLILGGIFKLFPYYKAFLEFLSAISWPLLIYFIARMFRGRLENVVEAISQRVANLVELKILGSRAIFDGGRVDEGKARFDVLPPPKER